MGKITYTFQCPRCFIVSGHMSQDIDGAPTCCGGVYMDAVRVGADEEAAKLKRSRATLKFLEENSSIFKGKNNA